MMFARYSYHIKSSRFIERNSRGSRGVLHPHPSLQQIETMRKLLKIISAMVKRISIDMVRNISLATRNEETMHSNHFSTYGATFGIERACMWVPPCAPVCLAQHLIVARADNSVLPLRERNKSDRLVLRLFNLVSNHRGRHVTLLRVLCGMAALLYCTTMVPMSAQIINPGGGGSGTTTNALTGAASGGAAPGTTFNGSAVVTFDAHTFGAAPIASPVFTGMMTLAPGVLPTGITISALPSTGNTTLEQYYVTDACSIVDATVGGCSGGSAYPHAVEWTGSAPWKTALPVQPVALGGTGLTTLTPHAVQIGEGTSTPNQMAVCGTGVPVVGVTGADPICSASGALGTGAFAAAYSLPTQAADTVLQNASGSTAAPTAVAMPTCTTGADLYNTSTHTWSCVSTGGGGGLYLGGNCPGTISGAGTWGVLNMGGVPTSGSCSNAWTANTELTVTHACTLQNLYFSSAINGTSGSDLVITAWTGAAGSYSPSASALTCTAGSGATCSDTTHTVLLTAGQHVTVKIATVAGSATGNFSVGMECD